MLRRRATLCLAVTAALVAAGPSVARAQRPSYQLDVRVDARRAELSGRARITFIHTGSAPLDRLLLWAYPERFSVRSAALNDYNFYWVYPYRFNPASLQVISARVGGRTVGVERTGQRPAGPRTLIGVPLQRPLSPGESVTVEIDYRIHLPSRYGAFGCYRGTCILGGGFYPMLPPLGRDGFDLQAPPARADFDLSVTAARPSDVMLQGELYKVAAGQTRRATLLNVRAPALLVGRPLLRSQEIQYRGVRVVFHLSWPLPVPTPPGFVVPYWPSDRAGLVMDTARQLIDTLATLGLPMPAQGIHLFQGALRTEVALGLPGAVLVSDHIFDMFPPGPFLTAHSVALAHAIFDELVERRLDGSERPADEGWAPDVVASFLADRFAQGLEKTRPHAPTQEDSARAAVAKVGFLPEADRILYAPQVPFATAYFHTLADPDPLRDNLTQFNNDWPRGHTIYEKLLDLLGPAQVERIVRAQLDGVPIRQAAEVVYGGSLGWFFAQWLGPYPKVDYTLGDVHVTRAGSGYRVSLRVDKRGAHPPSEPVEVQVKDRRGGVQSQRWDGQGRSHRYLFELPAPVEDIRLDPRGRLVESLPGSNDDLKFGERIPSKWKLLLGKINLASGASTFDVEVDFNLSRVRDLKNTLRLAFLHNEITTIGLEALYIRWFGDKVTPAKLDWNVSTGLIAARVPGVGTTGVNSLPGEAFTAVVGLGYDDRLFVWEPLTARTFALTASYTVTVLDNAAVFQRGDVTASWESIVRLADGHGLALLAAGGIAFGYISAAQQLISSGGPTGLRAFSLSDLLGRASLLGRAEYRHVFTHALNINILSTYYLHGISGALFAEGALTTACSSYAVDASSGAADVGYGINFIADWFGLAPNVIGIGVAVPLLNPNRECYGTQTTTTSRSPVVLFTFGPPW